MEKIIDKTYGESLFEYAKETSLVDVFYAQAKDIINVISASPEFYQFLTNPKISGDDKKSVVKNLFSEKIWKDGKSNLKILDFVYLVIDKGREKYLCGMLEEFNNLARDYSQIGLCEISSASELTNAQKEKLSEKLLKITDFKSFEFKYRLDPSLLAGLRIRIGDTVVDTTVKNKLDQINKSLRGIKLWIWSQKKSVS